MKYSLCYSHYKKKRDLVLAADEAQEKVRLVKSVQTAEIQAAHDVAKLKLLAASSLDELRVEQITTVASKELSKIVASGKKVAAYTSKWRSQI
jgi:hypothetical protein